MIGTDGNTPPFALGAFGGHATTQEAVSAATAPPEDPARGIPESADTTSVTHARVRAGMEAAIAWNAKYPLGTPVLRWLTYSPEGGRGGEPVETRTRTEAWVLGHGVPVVSVVGHHGAGVPLDLLQPIPEGATDD